MARKSLKLGGAHSLSGVGRSLRKSLKFHNVDGGGVSPPYPLGPRPLGAGRGSGPRGRTWAAGTSRIPCRPRLCREGLTVLLRPRQHVFVQRTLTALAERGNALAVPDRKVA